MTIRAFMLSAQVVLFLCVAGGTASAARYVPVEVRLNGEVILEGNVSDDGHRDADELWEALKVSDLGEAEAFKKLRVAPDLNEYKVAGGGDKAEPLPVQIKVRYGGVAQSRAITIRRVPPDSAGRVWRISAADVDDSFDGRMLSRREAAKLVNPKLEKGKAKR